MCQLFTTELIDVKCFKIKTMCAKIQSYGYLHSMLDIVSISTYVYTLTQNFVSTCEKSSYPHIANIANFNETTLGDKK